MDEIQAKKLELLIKNIGIFNILNKIRKYKNKTGRKNSPKRRYGVET